MVEYALLGAVFIVIFITAALYLRQAGQHRANESMEVGNDYIPCSSGALSGDQCL